MTVSATATSHNDVFTGALSLNEISALNPSALEVFAHYGLDSCCGGAKRLDVVCEKHQLALADVLRDLRALK